MLPAPCFALGLDVGGTKIAGGWARFPDGAIHSQRALPTAPERGAAAVLADLSRLARELMAEARSAQTPVSAIGLGVCELVDRTGGIHSANTIDWRDASVRTVLESLAPLTVEADVRAAARAEALFGAGRGRRHVLFVAVGTGIACSLVIEGEPFLGARGLTGTMASSPLNGWCPACGRRHDGTLESLASGPALVRRYNTQSARHAERGQDVIAAAVAGDPHALEVVQTGAEALGVTLGILVSTLDPELVILGGGLGLSAGPYWDALVTSTRRHIWSPLHRDLPIVRAATGTAAGWLGAAAAAWMSESRKHGPARSMGP